MKIEQEITELSAKYYELIGADHHKDRDCHWTIETKWSYGQPPVYIVEHHGYLHNTERAKFETYAGALAYLKSELKDAIEIEEFHKANLDGIRFPDDIPGELRAFEL
jgi:exonuclease III